MISKAQPSCNKKIPKKHDMIHLPFPPNRNKFLFVKQQLVTTYLLTELVLVKTLNFQTVQPQQLISLKHHFLIFFLPVS